MPRDLPPEEKNKRISFEQGLNPLNPDSWLGIVAWNQAEILKDWVVNRVHTTKLTVAVVGANLNKRPDAQIQHDAYADISVRA